MGKATLNIGRLRFGERELVCCIYKYFVFSSQVILAQAAVYLARACKSIEVYNAYSEAKKLVNDWEGPQPSVPLHIRNAPTKLMKGLGYGAGYKYNPAFDGPIDQTYLPPEVQGVDFFTWSKKKKK